MSYINNKVRKSLETEIEKIDRLYQEVFKSEGYFERIVWGCGRTADSKSQIQVLHDSIDELRKEIDKIHTYLKVAPVTTKERHYLKKNTPKRKKK